MEVVRELIEIGAYINAKDKLKEKDIRKESIRLGSCIFPSLYSCLKKNKLIKTLVFNQFAEF